MKERQNCDIAIIGGGASGYAAALGIFENCAGCDVIMAERLAKTGRKLLVTGSGRCNLGNKDPDRRFYHGSFDNVSDIIGKAPDTAGFFRKIGVSCITDAQGRMYPRSESAASVLTSLRLATGSRGLREVCDFEALSITGSDGEYTVNSRDSSINCKKIIIACGGYAAPSYGTDGSMIRILRKMGYKTGAICPAVAPLKTDPKKLKGLGGVRVKCLVSAYAGDRLLRSERGEVQFTDSMLSGICIFDLAYLMSEHSEDLDIYIDLMPDVGIQDLEESLFLLRDQRGMFALEEYLTGFFNRKLAVYIIKNTVSRPLSDRISSLSDSEIKEITGFIKSVKFGITGTAPWKNAQATCGGIHSSCVDGMLESELHRGIYFCGEILDTVGDCGGYNLQWAWSSGYYAGENCALSLMEGADV